MIRQILRQKTGTTYADCRPTASLCGTTRNSSHTIRQLLHQHNILALCNTKGDYSNKTLSLPFTFTLSFLDLDL